MLVELASSVVLLEMIHCCGQVQAGQRLTLSLGFQPKKYVLVLPVQRFQLHIKVEETR